MRRGTSLAAAVFAAANFASIGIGGAAAKSAAPALDYAACMKLAREAPETALERAEQWRSLGGGTAAAHCQASALIGLGRAKAAARLLEEAVREGRESLDVVAGLLRQGAYAWIEAGEGGEALRLFDAAVDLTSGDDKARLRLLPELLEDRAILLVERGEPASALRDLDAALEIDSTRLSALILRAATHRRLGRLDLARNDLEQAFLLAPDDNDALVEQGALNLEMGDVVAARAAWDKVVRQDPESPAADVARLRLGELMGQGS